MHNHLQIFIRVGKIQPALPQGLKPFIFIPLEFNHAYYSYNLYLRKTRLPIFKYPTRVIFSNVELRDLCRDYFVAHEQ